MARRKQVWAALGLALLVGIASGAMMAAHGCGQLPRLTGTLLPSEERSRKLVSLAAQEATQIEDVDARLTRLLNFAETQIQRKWLADARATLAAGRRTLGSEDARKLNDHARISGWVSVSELSREASDNTGAIAACDGAVTTMRAIEDPARRCDYVMGVCNELQYLKGKPAAALLMAEAGPWAKAIDDVPRRRMAVVSFASALFNLDDFTRGQQMLQQEADAAWRSDTLVRMASLTVPDTSRIAVRSAIRETAVVSPDQSQLSNPYFGKQLNYRDVFRGQTNSQTREE